MKVTLVHQKTSFSILLANQLMKFGLTKVILELQRISLNILEDLKVNLLMMFGLMKDILVHQKTSLNILEDQKENQLMKFG